MRLLLCLVALAVCAGPAVAKPGDFDPSFGGQGVFVGPGGTPMDRIDDLVRLGDGGFFAFAGGQRFGRYGGVIAKLQADGGYERSFGWDGHAPAAAGPPNATMLIQPDGRILVVGVAGFAGGPLIVERFLPNGDPDRSFGEAGRMEFDPWRVDPRYNGPGYLAGAVLDAQGRIVAVGRVAGRNKHFLGMVRLLSDGQVDPSFGNAGIVRHRPRGSSWARATRVQIDSRGEILVTGGLTNGTGFDEVGNPVLARFNATGRLDREFGRDGFVKGPESFPGVAFANVVELPGERLVVAGIRGADDYYEDSWVLRRYGRDGARDWAFGIRGVTRIPVTSDGYEEGSSLSTTLVYQPDGKLLVAGTHVLSYRGGSGADVAVARVRKTGRLDREFGGDGVIQPALGHQARTMYDSKSGYDEVYAVLLLPDERVVLGGSALRAPPGHPHGSEHEYMLARLADSIAPRSLRRLPRSLVVDGTGETSFRLGCREAGSSFCSARLRLGRAASDLVRLTPGSLTTVTMRLTRRSRRGLARSRRMEVRATLRFRDDNGNSNTLRRRIRLRAE